MSAPAPGWFQINRASTQAVGLVEWWPALATPGSNILRGLNLGLNAALVGGAAYSGDGTVGLAVGFDGANDYADAGASAPLSVTGHLTLAGWVYRTGVTGTAQQVASKGFNSGNTQYQMYFEEDAGFSRLRRMLFGTYNGLHQQVVSASEVAANVWQHWVGTWDGAAYRLYLNGKLDAESANTTAPIPTTSRFCIGAVHAQGVGDEFIQHWAGRIADVRLYNRALPPAVIWQMWDPATRWDLYDIDAEIVARYPDLAAILPYHLFHSHALGI